MLPEHIDPDDVDLTDDQLLAAYTDGRPSPRPEDLPETIAALRRVAKAQDSRTALYLGMYYGQETAGALDESPLQRAIGGTLAASIGQYYRNEFDADGFRKVLDLHLLSNLITDMLAEKYGLDPSVEPADHAQWCMSRKGCNCA